MKTKRAKLLKDLDRTHRAILFNQVTALRQEVVALEKASLEGKDEVHRLREIVEHEQQKVLNQHERLVEQHMNDVSSIRRRANTAEQISAAVSERFQAVYARCSGPDQRVGERPKRLKELVRCELEAVEAKCAQFLGDRFGDFTRDLVNFLKKNNESLIVSVEELPVVKGILSRLLRLLPFDRWLILTLFLQFQLAPKLVCRLDCRY